MSDPFSNLKDFAFAFNLTHFCESTLGEIEAKICIDIAPSYIFDHTSSAVFVVEAAAVEDANFALFSLCL